MTFQKMKTIQLPILAKMAVMLVLASTVFAAKSNAPTVFLETFKTQGFDKLGNLSWKLSGTNAKIIGSKVHLEKSITDLFNKDGLTKVFAKDSVFNRDTSLWKSEKAVKVNGKLMNAEGTGFTLNTKTKRLLIHKDVKVVLKSLFKNKSEK